MSTQSAVPSPVPAIRSKTVANVVRGSLGNLVEWYDWFVYTSCSIYFAASFFPKGNQTAQLLSTAVVFAVGFLMRPLGGWLLGLYADRFGRRAALNTSVLVMGLGSLTIAATPSYATIGIAAPVLLVLARMAQGLSWCCTCAAPWRSPSTSAASSSPRRRAPRSARGCAR